MCWEAQLIIDEFSQHKELTSIQLNLGNDKESYFSIYHIMSYHKISITVYCRTNFRQSNVDMDLQMNSLKKLLQNNPKKISKLLKFNSKSQVPCWISVLPLF